MVALNKSASLELCISIFHMPGARPHGERPSYLRHLQFGLKNQHVNGRDLRRKPLMERKRILRSLVPTTASPILYAECFDSTGTELYRAVCDMDLEGIVAKRKDGLYTPEETTWVKIRNPHYSQGEGRRELFEKRSAAVG